MVVFEDKVHVCVRLVQLHRYGNDGSAIGPVVPSRMNLRK